MSEKWIKSPFVRSHSTTAFSSNEEAKQLIYERFQQELSERFDGKASVKKDLPFPIARKPQATHDLKAEETFPISNAGLVLAAPFLPYFFRGLGLVEKKEFV